MNMFKKEKDIKMTIYMLLGNNLILEEQIKTDLLHLKSLIEKPN